MADRASNNADVFHGAIIRSTSPLPGLTFSETVHLRRVVLTKHFHSQAYLSFILEGRFEEMYGRSSSKRRARALVFHPPGEFHSNCFHETTRAFNVQMDTAWLEKLPSAIVAPDAAVLESTLCSFLVMKLYREFTNFDDLSPLIIEGLMLEMLGTAGRGAKLRVGSPPKWLLTARSWLHDNYQRNVGIAELAAIAGVHQTHLAGEFRRYFGTTIGDYIRQLRVQFACSKLSDSTASMTDIALAAGFFDHSHFIRVFKTHVRMTPLQYRRTFFRR